MGTAISVQPQTFCELSSRHQSGFGVGPSVPASEGFSSFALTPGPPNPWRDEEKEEGKLLAYTYELFPSYSVFLHRHYRLF